MTHCTIPMMDIPSICAFFKEMCPELDVIDNDFRKPQKEKWQNIYLHLASCITGAIPDSINQPSLEAQGNLDYPELYEDSIPLINLSIAMSKVAYASGLDNFTLLDIVDPSQKRLILICSALANFMRFRSERLDVYDRFKAENVALLEHRDMLRRDNDEIQNEINIIRASRAEKEPEVQKAQERLQQLGAKIDEMHKKSAALQKKHTDIRTDLSEKAAVQARLKDQVVTAKEENARLSGKIVQSPERVKGEMGRMKRNLDQLHVACKERRARLVELQRKQSQMKQWDTQAEDMERLVKAIDEKISREKVFMEEIRQMMDQQGQLKERYQELVAEEAQMRRLVTTRHDKLAKVNIQHSSMMQDLTETLDSLQCERERFMQEQTEEEGEKSRILQAKQELHAQDVKKTREHEAAMAEIRSAYRSMLGALDSYHQHLGEAWQKVKQNFQQYKDDSQSD